MSTRLSSMKKSNFWDGFFFAFGFTANPILRKAKEIKRKSVDERISQSWEATSDSFRDRFEKETCLIND